MKKKTKLNCFLHLLQPLLFHRRVLVILIAANKLCTLNSQLQCVELLGKVVKNRDAISFTKECLDINPVLQWPLKQGILKHRHRRNASAVAVRLNHINFRWFICVLLCRIINRHTVIMQLQTEPLHTINRDWYHVVHRARRKVKHLMVIVDVLRAALLLIQMWIIWETQLFSSLLFF